MFYESWTTCTKLGIRKDRKQLQKTKGHNQLRIIFFSGTQGFIFLKSICSSKFDLVWLWIRQKLDASINLLESHSVLIVEKSSKDN